MTDVLVMEDWESPLWRLDHIYYVLSDEGKEVHFRLRELQREYQDNLWYRNVLLKSRQHGATTHISLMQLDSCIFNKNFVALTIAETLPKAMDIFRTKIEYPWKRLPQSLRDRLPLKEATKSGMTWDHGSKISVGTSGRSGTLQSLHVSEYGPIAAHAPEKAKEIQTGSFEAVPLPILVDGVLQDGGVIHVESTGMGQAGRFFELCDRSMKRKEQKLPETPMDFRLHFFPWWRKASNRLDQKGVLIPAALVRYFRRLLDEKGIILDPEQKAWYCKKHEEMPDDIKSEHPSYPDEAFEVVIEGAILGKEMATLRKMGRIGAYPWHPKLPVNTTWDFGVDDSTSIWLHQRIQGLNRYIGYFEDQGEGLGYYVNELNSYGFVWGTHFIPHDADARGQSIEVVTKKQDLWKLGFRKTKVVPRIAKINLGIDQLRSYLLTCEFDAKGCADGIKALDHYQREWDEKLGKWKDTVRHDWASHAADSLRQMAQGYIPDEDRRVIPVIRDEVLEDEIGY